MAGHLAGLPAKKAVKRRSTTDIWNDGPGDKTESQQVFALSRLLKKPRSDQEELQQFGEAVAADQKKLKEMIAQRSKDVATKQKHHDNELASRILEALGSPNHCSPSETATIAGTKIAKNAMYARITDVLNASENLVSEYQRLEDMIAKLRREERHSVVDRWKHDVGGTEEQLRLGARVALRKVTKMLGSEMVDEDITGETGEEEVRK